MRQQSFAASASFAFLLVAAGAVGAGAAPAQARQTQQGTAQTSVAGAAASEKKICKRLEITGSRMANQRVCLTRDDWKKVDEVK